MKNHCLIFGSHNKIEHTARTVWTDCFPWIRQSKIISVSHSRKGRNLHCFLLSTATESDSITAKFSSSHASHLDPSRHFRCLMKAPTYIGLGHHPLHSLQGFREMKFLILALLGFVGGSAVVNSPYAYWLQRGICPCDILYFEEITTVQRPRARLLLKVLTRHSKQHHSQFPEC